MADISFTIVGFTGAFGSGCTTGALALRDKRDFRVVTPSDFIRTEWLKENKGDPSRSDLQAHGDALRLANGHQYVIARTLDDFIAANPDVRNIAIDGIRNEGEILYLRDRFGYHFTLIAVLSSNDNRWDRLESSYKGKGLSERDFAQDAARDKGEETPYGQQVSLCIDGADVLVANNGTRAEFKSKVLDAVDLVSGRSLRNARDSEIFMNIAYSASHSSKCVKRHVGAVIVDSKGQVVSAGYNENPVGTNACIEEPEYGKQCFRDKIRNEKFELLANQKAMCPKCATQLSFKPGPPWKCEKCAETDPRQSLEEFFFPDRALNWCTAIHAEVWAILAAGSKCEGSTLYTTTFPCTQCAEKISQVKLKKVIFTEGYPDSIGVHRLQLAKIELEQFEGIRSSSFERIFGRGRPR